VVTFAATPCSSQERKPARKFAVSGPVTARRCSNAVRVTAVDNAMSAASALSVVAPSSASAWARSAAAERAETNHGTGPAARGPRSAGSCSGACSTIVCALVPLTPKEDTAARRGRPVSGHGSCAVTGRTAPAVQSTSDESRSACRVFGTSPWRMASTALMIPATPAAAWVCPKFDLTEPISRSCSRSRP
jgi:hypothetical protein